jgi:hypothetical protein
MCPGPRRLQGVNFVQLPNGVSSWITTVIHDPCLDTVEPLHSRDARTADLPKQGLQAKVPTCGALEACKLQHNAGAEPHNETQPRGIDLGLGRRAARAITPAYQDRGRKLPSVRRAADEIWRPRRRVAGSTPCVCVDRCAGTAGTRDAGPGGDDDASSPLVVGCPLRVQD